METKDINDNKYYCVIDENDYLDAIETLIEKGGQTYSEDMPFPINNHQFQTEKIILFINPDEHHLILSMPYTTFTSSLFTKDTSWQFIPIKQPFKFNVNDLVKLNTNNTTLNQPLIVKNRIATPQGNIYTISTSDKTDDDNNQLDCNENQLSPFISFKFQIGDTVLTKYKPIYHGIIDKTFIKDNSPHYHIKYYGNFPESELINASDNFTDITFNDIQTLFYLAKHNEYAYHRLINIVKFTINAFDNINQYIINASNIPNILNHLHSSLLFNTDNAIEINLDLSVIDENKPSFILYKSPDEEYSWKLPLNLITNMKEEFISYRNTLVNHAKYYIEQSINNLSISKNSIGKELPIFDHLK